MLCFFIFSSSRPAPLVSHQIKKPNRKARRFSECCWRRAVLPSRAGLAEGMTVREARTHVGASQANTSTGITHKCRLCGAQEEGRDRGTPVPPDHQLELNKPRLQTQTQADRHSACGSFTFLLTLPWKQLKCLC